MPLLGGAEPFFGDLGDLGDRPVVDLASGGGQGDAPGLDLAEADPERVVGDGPVGQPERPRLGERAERGLPQQHVGALPGRWALDVVDHPDPAPAHPGVQVVDVEDPRRQVVDVGASHPADVGRDGADRLELVVPGAVDRLR